MDRDGTSARVYGSRYHETRTIIQLDVLAERILADLPALLDSERLPASIDFGIQIVANVQLRLSVGGLPDALTFADRVSGRYSRPAIELIGRLVSVLESYNWTNPDKPTDRRFFSSVYLADEAEYRSILWTPGVVRMF